MLMRFIHPRATREREEFRASIARTRQSIEDVGDATRTICAMEAAHLREWLANSPENRREVANDIQQVVIFQTFSETCQHRHKNGIGLRCGHKEHEAADSGRAICNEEQCPFMRR